MSQVDSGRDIARGFGLGLDLRAMRQAEREAARRRVMEDEARRFWADQIVGAAQPDDPIAAMRRSRLMALPVSDLRDLAAERSRLQEQLREAERLDRWRQASLAGLNRGFEPGTRLWEEAKSQIDTMYESLRAGIPAGLTERTLEITSPDPESMRDEMLAHAEYYRRMGHEDMAGTIYQRANQLYPPAADPDDPLSETVPRGHAPTATEQARYEAMLRAWPQSPAPPAQTAGAEGGPDGPSADAGDAGDAGLAEQFARWMMTEGWRHPARLGRLLHGDPPAPHPSTSSTSSHPSADAEPKPARPDAPDERELRARITTDAIGGTTGEPPGDLGRLERVKSIIAALRADGRWQTMTEAEQERAVAAALGEETTP